MLKSIVTSVFSVGKVAFNRLRALRGIMIEFPLSDLISVLR